MVMVLPAFFMLAVLFFCPGAHIKHVESPNAETVITAMVVLLLLLSLCI